MQLWSLIISVCPIQVVNILSEEIAACNMKHVMLSLKLIKNVSTAPTFHTLHSTLHTALAIHHLEMWPFCHTLIPHLMLVKSIDDINDKPSWKLHASVSTHSTHILSQQELGTVPSSSPVLTSAAAAWEGGYSST